MFTFFFRLNTENLITSITNSTVSLINSVFSNTIFYGTMIDLSYFLKLKFENLLIFNILVTIGIKIHDGDASRVTMNFIQFKNISSDDDFFIFQSLNSNLMINNLELTSFLLRKSKNIKNNQIFFL